MLHAVTTWIAHNPDQALAVWTAATTLISAFTPQWFRLFVKTAADAAAKELVTELTHPTTPPAAK